MPTPESSEDPGLSWQHPPILVTVPALQAMVHLFIRGLGSLAVWGKQEVLPRRRPALNPTSFPQPAGAEGSLDSLLPDFMEVGRPGGHLRESAFPALSFMINDTPAAYSDVRFFFETPLIF